MKMCSCPAGIRRLSDARLCRVLVLGLALSATAALSAEILPQPKTVLAKPATDTYYLNDHLATALATMDTAGVIAQIEADAFGAPISATPTFAHYTGKPYDDDRGAYVFPFRDLRPDNQNWKSIDPSGFPDGKNGMQYAVIYGCSLDKYGLAIFSYSNSGTLNEGQNFYYVSAYLDDNRSNSGLAMSTDTFSFIQIGDIALPNSPTPSSAIASRVWMETPSVSGVYMQEIKVYMEIENVSNPITFNWIETQFFSANQQKWYGRWDTLSGSFVEMAASASFSDLFAVQTSFPGTQNKLLYYEVEGKSQFFPFTSGTFSQAAWELGIAWSWPDNEQMGQATEPMASRNLYLNSTLPSLWSGRNTSNDAYRYVEAIYE
jgi:hypothetical protein